MLHLVRCLYYLYQWCTVKQISDNEIYLLIKDIKSVLWRVAKCLSYIEEARCLKVNVSPCYNIDLPVGIQIFSVQKIRKYFFHLYFASITTTSRLISVTTVGTLAQKLTYIENFWIWTCHNVSVSYRQHWYSSLSEFRKINMRWICRDNCIGILRNV